MMKLSVLKMQDLAQSGQLKGKRVFIRSDMNVPMSDGEIADDTRIKASLPAIRMALDAGAAVMVTTHLGRPKEGEVHPGDSRSEEQRLNSSHVAISYAVF